MENAAGSILAVTGQSGHEPRPFISWSRIAGNILGCRGVCCFGDYSGMSGRLSSNFLRCLGVYHRNYFDVLVYIWVYSVMSGSIARNFLGWLGVYREIFSMSGRILWYSLLCLGVHHWIFLDDNIMKGQELFLEENKVKTKKLDYCFDFNRYK